MEELLDSLGATHSQLRHGYGWVLHRVNNYITLEADSTGIHVGEGGEWLLIGEITEALREKGLEKTTVSEDDELNPRCELGVYLKDRPVAYYGADTLLDCYIQAAKELL